MTFNISDLVFVNRNVYSLCNLECLFKATQDHSVTKREKGYSSVAVLGFAVWGQWGGRIFSWGSQNYTIAATDPGFGDRGFVRGSGELPSEAEAFSLNYTLILDFLSII